MINLFPKLPLICNYYLTVRCNAKCSFCNIWKKDIPEEPSLENLEKNIKDLKRLHFKIIDFTGGEPLLYPNIIAALTLANKFRLFTTLTTNCILYPTYAKKLNGLIDILFFSIDSADKNENNLIRGADTYNSVLESIDIAKKIKQRYSLISTITDENISGVENLIKFAQNNYSQLYLNPCFEYFGNKSLSKESASKLIQYSKEPYIFLDHGYLEFIVSGGNNTNTPLCKALSSSLVITPDNRLALPCFHNGLKYIEIENNLYNLYNSPVVESYRKNEGKYDFCSGCTNYCYFRTSLFRKYPLKTLRTYFSFLHERYFRK